MLTTVITNRIVFPASAIPLYGTGARVETNQFTPASNRANVIAAVKCNMVDCCAVCKRNWHTWFKVYCNSPLFVWTSQVSTYLLTVYSKSKRCVQVSLPLRKRTEHAAENRVVLYHFRLPEPSHRRFAGWITAAFQHGLPARTCPEGAG